MRYISLFSGVEAASVAWEPLGWEPVAFAEIEPFPCSVLKERFPEVPNLGDVTKVDWSDYRGKADLVIGGSPCQSFSIAGLRKGLADPRGNLMLEYLRACYEIGPEWIVWENVPGVLSADGRRAFQAFLEAVVQLWPRGGVCWRVLDAQFFGVAQRRRRLFAVVNTRDWRRAAAVLLEPGCLRGDSPSSRDKRKALAGVPGGGAVERDPEGRREEDVRAGGGRPGPVRVQGRAAPAAYAAQVRCGCRGGGKGALVQEDVSATLATGNHQAIFQPETCYSLTPGISTTAKGAGVYEQCSPTLRALANSNTPAVCYSIDGDIARGAHMGQNGKGWSDDGASPTLSTADVPAVAFTQNQRDEVRLEGGDGQVVGAVAARPGSRTSTTSARSTATRSPARSRRGTTRPHARTAGRTWSAWRTTRRIRRLTTSCAVR